MQIWTSFRKEIHIQNRYFISWILYIYPFQFQNNFSAANNIVTFPSGCSLALHSISIEPDTNSVDNEFETKHHKLFWDSDVPFPNYNNQEFGEVLISFRNKMAISIDFLNHAIKIRNQNIKHTSEISNGFDSVALTNEVFITLNIMYL